MDAASGFVRWQLQDSRTRRAAFESEVTPRYDGKIVSILASGLHGAGVGRFREARHRRRRG